MKWIIPFLNQTHGGARANTFKNSISVTSYPMAYGIKSPMYFWALFNSCRFPLLLPTRKHPLPSGKRLQPYYFLYVSLEGVPPPCQPSTIFKPPQPKHGGFCSSRSQLFIFSDLLQVLKYPALLRNTGCGSTDFSMWPLLRLDIEYQLTILALAMGTLSLLKSFQSHAYAKKHEINEYIQCLFFQKLFQLWRYILAHDDIECEKSNAQYSVAGRLVGSTLIGVL